MSTFINRKVIDELSDQFKGFNFKEALSDILEWQDGLDDNVEDTITFNVLEGVLDIILDRSEF